MLNPSKGIAQPLLTESRGAKNSHSFVSAFFCFAFALSFPGVYFHALYANQLTLNECREERRISPRQYWFWEGYSGLIELVDSNGERRGRLFLDPATCIRVPLSELNNAIVRSLGYRDAIVELFKQLPREPEKWDKDPQVLSTRLRIKSLTGLEFPSPAAMRRWWIENEDYLVWSNRKKLLIVDAEAKRQNKPIPEWPFISAADYWFYRAMGWLEVVRHQREFVQAKAWTGHDEMKVRYSKKALADRVSKQQGYLRAVETRLNQLPYLEGASLEKVLDHLRSLTGISFQDRESCLRWWQENKAKLVLSRDGSLLVVKPSSQ